MREDRNRITSASVGSGSDGAAGPACSAWPALLLGHSVLPSTHKQWIGAGNKTATQTLSQHLWSLEAAMPVLSQR